MKQMMAGLLLLALAACQPAGLSDSVAWVAYSDEWKQEAQDVYTRAGDYVAQQAARHRPGRWAVVMDLDETVLDNVDYQIGLQQRGESFTQQNWHDWVLTNHSPLVPGAKAFIKQVNALGGQVAFITNRSNTEQLETEKNLAAHGILRGEDFRILITKTSPDGTGNKEARFDGVVPLLKAMGYPDARVIAYVGDTAGDKPAKAGSYAFFCINQGGMYGEPCEAQD